MEHCIDYKELKEVTINKYLLARNDNLFDQLYETQVFSKYLICSRIIIQKTVFKTTYGYSKFLVMPFRVINAHRSEFVITNFFSILL